MNKGIYEKYTPDEWGILFGLFSNEAYCSYTSHVSNDILDEHTFYIFLNAVLCIIRGLTHYKEIPNTEHINVIMNVTYEDLPLYLDRGIPMNTIIKWRFILGR